MSYAITSRTAQIRVLTFLDKIRQSLHAYMLDTTHYPQIRCVCAPPQLGMPLDQRDDGIKPFSAMMGALKVKPILQIKIRLLSP